MRAAFFAVAGGLPPLDPPRLLVLGGSQGAQQINQALPAAAARLLERLPALRILHQAGARNLEETRAAYARGGTRTTGRVEVVPFLDDVAGAMAASHLLVSRAGAITLAEICAAGRASLLLPLAIAQGHQVDNARLLAEAGARRDDPVRPSSRPSGWPTGWRRCSATAAGLDRMGRAARSLARPRAVADIADRLEDAGRTVR